jgi:type I restriction enzyme M protein
VYESGRSREPKNIIRLAIVAKPGTKPDRKAIEGLEEVLGNLAEDRAEVFGIWTNGDSLAFRMRTFEPRTGQPVYTELTDFPAPQETLADLESGTRRPLRIAAGDSLLRAFKRCHDYIHGNQSMSPDKAFWQILYYYSVGASGQAKPARLYSPDEPNLHPLASSRRPAQA